MKFYTHSYGGRWPFREWNLSVGRLTVSVQMLRHDGYEDGDEDFDHVRYVLTPIRLVWDSKS